MIVKLSDQLIANDPQTTIQIEPCVCYEVISNYTGLQSSLLVKGFTSKVIKV